MATTLCHFSACGRWLPVGDFYPRNRPPWHFPQCKDCHNAAVAWKRLDDRHQNGGTPHFQPSDSGMVLCRVCGELRQKTHSMTGAICDACAREQWQRDNEKAAAKRRK